MPLRPYPFVLVSPATRGLSLALTRHFLKCTNLPVYATYRSSSADSDDIRKTILSESQSAMSEGPSHGVVDVVDPKRLHLIPLELTAEKSIQDAANTLAEMLPKDQDPFLHTAFFTGGVLHPEKSPADFNIDHINESFQINAISHMLLIKHFSQFLPAAHQQSSSSSNSESGPASSKNQNQLSKWVHVSARVGSISDNRIGGWYSYRASKSALNQVVRTFDLHLKQKHIPAVCVGVHPGTVKTNLSKAFWGSVKKEMLFEPEYAAERLVEVVGALGEDAGGKVWDWAGKEVPP